MCPLQVEQGVATPNLTLLPRSDLFTFSYVRINRSGCFHSGFVLDSHMGITQGGQSHGMYGAFLGCGFCFY